MKPYILLIVLFSALISFAAQADVIEERKANFKKNGSFMKAIKGHIQSGDFEAIANGGRDIASWANQIPDFFPEGSESKGTLEAIWMDFDDFRAKAEANRKAALVLESAAQSGDRAKVMNAVKALGDNCKACHDSYKAD